MPFIGFVCEADESAVAPEQCRACARQGARPGCQQSAPVITGILNGLRSGHALTVTVLLGCARKARLMQTEDYQLKPAEAWWAYRGQLMHGVSAAYAQGDPDAIAEQRFSMLVDAGSGEALCASLKPTASRLVEISGQPDLVLVDRRHLVDYKTTKAVPGPWRTWTCPTLGVIAREGQFACRTKWLDCPACSQRHEAAAIETQHPPRAYASHIQQVSLYRLLLWENGIEVDTAEIIYQDMRQQLRVPVELLSLSEARTLLEARLAEHTQPNLPDVLRDPDDIWQCNFCPVRAACERQHGVPLGHRG